MLESLESLNHSLFLLINAGAHPPQALYLFAWLSAEGLIYILAAALAIGWLRGNTKTRWTLVYAGLVATTALLINRLIGLVWYHPRPFEIGLGHTLSAHTPETSFPSDHATVFFSITLALLFRPRLRVWGLILVPVSLLVAWSRVWLGIHYPLDILGSLIVSGMVVAVLNRPLITVSDWLNTVAEKLISSLSARLLK